MSPNHSHAPRPNGDGELELDALEDPLLHLLGHDGGRELEPDALSWLGGGAARDVNNHDGDGKNIRWDLVEERREHEREADKRCALYGGNVFVLV